MLIISSSRKVNFWTCPDKIAGTRPVSLPSWNMIMDGNCLVNGEVLTWYFTATSGYLPTSILPVKNEKSLIKHNIFILVSSKAESLQLNNTKILAYPCYTVSVYHTNLDWFSWEWSKKKFFFWRKKFKMADFSKWPFFKIANSQNFFAKISQIGPWVSRIDWCEGHWCSSTYMVVRLSDIRAKTA